MRQSRRLRVFVLPLLAALGAALVSAPTSARCDEPPLAKGLRQVEEGDFEAAIATLDAVVDGMLAARSKEAVQACVQLGVAHLALEQREQAKRRFWQALEIQPKLRLTSDRYSPKVIAAFEQARREHAAVAKEAASHSPGGGPRKPLLIGGAGVAGIAGAILATRGSGDASSGNVRFSAARFVPQAVTCPDGADALPMTVGIDVDAQNEGSQTAITSATSSLIIAASPLVPGEVGFASALQTSVSPTSVPKGSTTLHVRTTLTCANGTGDVSRFNEWVGRVTLVTAGGAVTLETSDRLRVNLP